MVIKKDTLDQLLAGRDPREVFAKDGLVDELKKALANRVLSAELDDHLDGEAAAGKPNRRNGYSKKTVLGESSKLELRIPRDREGTFDPKLIAKYQRRFPGFDAKIISMYARGMSVREIQGHLREIYGLDVSPVSTGTEVSPDVGFQNSLPDRFWFWGSAGVVIGLGPPGRAAAAFRRRRRRDKGFRANMLGNEIGMLAQAIA